MERLHFAVDINAPRETVWNVLWSDPTYRQWTRVFAEGSYAESDWNEGSTVKFLDANSGGGMLARIHQKRPHEYMSFKHLAEIKDGQEQPPADWAGAFENYLLKDRGGKTTLSVDVDIVETMKTFFEEKFPEALQRVKSLSET